MKATGIIAEYNPLHNGHRYHIEKTREITGSDCICAAISGNFTQRGELAFCDKWTRAEMAIRNGVDIVVEIPTLLAINNAAYFAMSGVRILEALGCDTISFGTEEGKLDNLLPIANILKEHELEIIEIIKSEKKNGLSYPKARAKALSSYLDELDLGKIDFEEILKKPNNNLAIEYLKYMDKARPLTIKREGDYNSIELDGQYTSATSIRESIRKAKSFNIVKDYVPKETYELLKKQKIVSNEMLYSWILQETLTNTDERLNSFYGAEEGLGSLLKKHSRTWSKYEDIINGLKSKAYTRTRIQRTLINMILHIRKENLDNPVLYIRILALSENGAKYLRELKNSDNLTLPIITNINKEAGKYPEIMPTLNYDILASDIYNVIYGKDIYLNSDFVKYPLKI